MHIHECINLFPDDFHAEVFSDFQSTDSIVQDNYRAIKFDSYTSMTILYHSVFSAGQFCKCY